MIEPTDQEYFMQKAKQNAAADAAHFAARRALGQLYHSITIEERCIVYQAALLDIEALTRPNVLELLQQFAIEHEKADGWAETVINQISIKKMTAALEKLYDTKVFRGLAQKELLTPRLKRDLAESSISGAIHRTYEQAVIVEKLKQHEREILTLKEKVARLEVISEIHSGVLGPVLKPWQARALEMARTGRVARVIAAEVGVDQTTVSSFLRGKIPQKRPNP